MPELINRIWETSVRALAAMNIAPRILDQNIKNLFKLKNIIFDIIAAHPLKYTYVTLSKSTLLKWDKEITFADDLISI